MFRDFRDSGMNCSSQVLQVEASTEDPWIEDRKCIGVNSPAFSIDPSLGYLQNRYY
jgi:hypothetical protein